MHIPWAIDPTTRTFEYKLQIARGLNVFFACEIRNIVDFVVVRSIAFSIRHFNRKSIYNVVFNAQCWLVTNTTKPEQ